MRARELLSALDIGSGSIASVGIRCEARATYGRMDMASRRATLCLDSGPGCEPCLDHAVGKKFILLFCFYYVKDYGSMFLLSEGIL